MEWAVKIDTGRKISLIVERDYNRLKRKPNLCLVFICPILSQQRQ